MRPQYYIILYAIPYAFINVPKPWIYCISNLFKGNITTKQYSTIYILTGSINYQESPLKLTDILYYNITKLWFTN